MKKRMICILLTAALAGSLCACSAEQATHTAVDIANSIGTYNSDEVQSVKNAYWTNYSSDITIGDAFASFLANPMWQYFEAESGEKVVQCNGECIYDDVTVLAAVQFVLNDDNTFSFHALAFNDINQDALTTAVFIEKIYETAKEKASQASSEPTTEIQPTDPPQGPASVNEDVETAQAEDPVVSDTDTPTDNNGIKIFSSSRFPEFSCGYPSELEVYNDGGDALFTAHNTERRTSIKIDVKPVSNSQTNTYKTYVNTHGGYQCVDYSKAGDDYFAVRMLWEDDMYYYAYYKFKHDTIYLFEAEFPESEFDYGDDVVNKMYQNFSLE